MADTNSDKEFRRRFASVEKKIAKHESNIKTIIDGFLANPERSNTYWTKIKVQLDAEYTAIGKVFSNWSKIEIPGNYDHSVIEQMRKARNQKASQYYDPKLTAHELIRSDYSVQTTATLYNSAIDDMFSGLALGRKNVDRLIRATRQTLLAEYAVDASVAAAYTEGNLRIATQIKKSGTLAAQLVAMSKNSQWIMVIDKNGNPRKYTPTYYSELVARTKWHEAQAQGAKATAINYGTDLVRVSSHNTTTAICQNYEGRIFSITGKNKDFPFLDMSPPFHPNCLHYVTVTFTETLQGAGTYKSFSEFSKTGEGKPPGLNTFVPLDERA